jgi:hypothetical protein
MSKYLFSFSSMILFFAYSTLNWKFAFSFSYTEATKSSSKIKKLNSYFGLATGTFDPAKINGIADTCHLLCHPHY